MADDVEAGGEGEILPPGAGADTDSEGEGELVPLSALEHYSYCPRQCALIHVEQTFDENLYTLRGRLSHERVDSGDDTPAHGVKPVRGVALWSDRLGLIGKTDLLELRPEGPYPVEYKSGKRQGEHAEVQLCAQALCLEDMLGRPVPRGALFFFGSRRRHEVEFTPELRARTLAVVAAVRRLLNDLALPPPLNDARCRHCSLGDACLPRVLGRPARLRGLQGALFQVWDPPEEAPR